MAAKLFIYCQARMSGVEPPEPATLESAGMDLEAAQDMTIGPNETAIVGTGLAVELPENHCMLILSRSGLALRGIVVANAPGLIDPDYRGEVKVLLRNTTGRPFSVSKKDRIAQALVIEFRQVEWKLATELEETDRGESGIGSTGL